VPPEHCQAGVSSPIATVMNREIHSNPKRQRGTRDVQQKEPSHDLTIAISLFLLDFGAEMCFNGSMQDISFNGEGCHEGAMAARGTA
jgi:hypothetical protein